MNLREPSVLLNKENEPYRTKTDSSWTDVNVFHPFTKYRNGRPKWLYYDNRKSVSINLKNITIDFPIILMAYNNKDDIINEAVPLDIVEVINYNKTTLVLSKGNYVIKAINENDICQLIEITVD